MVTTVGRSLISDTRNDILRIEINVIYKTLSTRIHRRTDIRLPNDKTDYVKERALFILYTAIIAI